MSTQYRDLIMHSLLATLDKPEAEELLDNYLSECMDSYLKDMVSLFHENLELKLQQIPRIKVL